MSNLKEEKKPELKDWASRMFISSVGAVFFYFCEYILTAISLGLQGKLSQELLMLRVAEIRSVAVFNSAKVMGMILFSVLILYFWMKAAEMLVKKSEKSE